MATSHRVIACSILLLGIACHQAKPGKAAVDAGPAPVCGNGIVERGEQCDDGNTTDSTDVCVSCKIVQCGGATFTTPEADAAKPFDTAGDFTLPTTNGSWNFKSHYTGCDSYLFIRQNSTVAYSTQLWNTTFDALLDNSPTDTHYIFFSDDMTAPAEAMALAANLSTYFSANSSAAATWQDRVHIVNVPTESLTGWIPVMLGKQGFLSFGIDKQQRLRETGYLANPLSASNPPIGDASYLRYMAQQFDFEFTREQQLAAEQNVTLTPLIAPDSPPDGGTPSSPGTVDVQLPNATAMAAFDTMEFDLTSSCAGNVDQNCPAWDQIGSLNICSPTPQANCGNGTVDMGEDCDDGASNGMPGDPCTRFCENANAPLHVCNSGQEIGRWITSYNRMGRWVTDASPMLAFLSAGGLQRFQYNSGGPSISTLTLRLRTSTPTHPTASSTQFLWSGGGFGPTYNMNHAPIMFTPPAGTTHVSFVAYITGHGWGQNAENCAEFCDTTHEIAVNGGTPHTKDAPVAGTEDGCAQQVVNGSVPNQYGTWPIGRDGWCPGLDVKPWSFDITSEVNLTGQNTITYQGLYNGMNYTPGAIADPNPSGFGAEITMNSYLVYYQ